MNTPKFYVTTPIYYPNAKPHLGTLYSTLLADISARWHQLMGYDICFFTGTDEHGQKLQEKALAEGKKPKEFIDTMIPAFKDLWKLYEINYHRFLRTTDKDHEQAVIVWIQKMLDQGDIYKSSYTGWYCISCESYINENEVGKNDFGKFICTTHQRSLTELAEESYFFRLSSYQDQLLKFYETHPDFITPKERFHEITTFVRSGLKDLSISRKNVSWGIPFPGDPTHTVYVWSDALLSYISAIGYGKNNINGDQQFAHWWPADVQVMAKDIMRFHAIYWPAFLMAAEIPLPKKLLVHGYVLMGEQKMSKSLGNVYDPTTLAETYGVEQIRYYLARQIPITQDGNFDINDLEKHINADLANNLGNLLNRTIALAQSNNLIKITSPKTWEPSSIALKEKCEETFRIYWEEMNKYYFHIALTSAWKFISEVNAFFHTQQPWILAKKNTDLFTEVISAVCHSLYMIGHLLWPIMPQKMEQLLQTLGIVFNPKQSYEKELRENEWKRSFILAKNSTPLFARIEQSNPTETAIIESEKINVNTQEDISIEDFAKIHLAVGTILSCEPVKGSNKLLKLEVDLGHLGKRQILSGIAENVQQENLLGKQGIFVVNLKPRKMMGLESHGMMLLAQDSQKKLIPTTVQCLTENGAKVA